MKQQTEVWVKMTLEEIKNRFEYVTIRKGDLGRYAEIWLKTHVTVYVYENPEYRPELEVNRNVCELLGVETIYDLKTLEGLINGKKQ